MDNQMKRVAIFTHPKIKTIRIIKKLTKTKNYVYDVQFCSHRIWSNKATNVPYEDVRTIIGVDFDTREMHRLQLKPLNNEVKNDG